MSNSFLGLSVAAIAALCAIPVQASPYVNVERNQAYEGSSSIGSVTEFHVGYKSALSDNANWYGQLGPALLSPQDDDSSTQLSGKIGADVNLNTALNAYGEFSFVTTEGDADNGFASKLGLTYTF